MGLLEVICIIVGVIVGSFLWLHSAGNDSGMAFGAAGGVMIGLGVAFIIRRISYMLFGYKAKDPCD